MTKVELTLELPGRNEVKKALMLPEEGNMVLTSFKNSISIKDLSPRTLVVLQYK